MLKYTYLFQFAFLDRFEKEDGEQTWSGFGFANLECELCQSTPIYWPSAISVS